MFLDYKIAHSKDSECTELLNDFSPADALHVKYPLSPITIYATKQEVKQYKHRLDFINITEIGEALAMMEMVRHNLDSDTHHLNNHMIDMVQKYMRGDATRMETYTYLGAAVYEFKHCKTL
jgi:hypothetical protein